VSTRIEWVLLAYRLPREPSAPRVTVWRKLRRLGVAQILDGLVALPADARTREHLEWIADEVLEAGGEASVWLGRLGSAAQDRELAERMAEAVAADYAAVVTDAATVEGETEVKRRRTVARLRREVQRIRPPSASGRGGRSTSWPPSSWRDEVGDARRGARRPSRVRLAAAPVRRS
jgi:ChrB-like protein